MTLADLIKTLLHRIGAEHYGLGAGGQPRVREFMRDERALTKAIARYGHECVRRGWEFEESDIWADIHQVLDTMRPCVITRKNRAPIAYLPTYLEGAIDRHIRLRAEELSAEAKRLAPKVTRVVERTASTVVVEKTVCETLDILYRDLRRPRRKATPSPATRPAKVIQPALL
jgi:hypothetical protein